MDNPDRITWMLGMTLQPRQFESIRIDCKIEGSREAGETLEEASSRVYKVVLDQISEKVREAREEMS